MKYLILIMFVLFTSNTLANNDCFNLEDGVIYEIKANTQLCLSNNNEVSLIYSGFQNTSLFTLTTDEDKALLFPDEYIHLKGSFSLKTTENMFIYNNDNKIVIVDSYLADIYKPSKRRSKRSIKPNGPTVATVVGAGAGAAIGGQNGIDAAIGAGVGIAVGAAVTGITRSPTAGAAASSATANIVTAGLGERGNISGNVVGGFSGLQHGSSGSGGCNGCH